MSIVAYALTTLSKVQTFTGESGNTTLLEMLIDDCTGFIENYCGNRRFVGDYTDESGDDTLDDVTQYYDGKGGHILQLDRYPIESITSISWATGDLNAPTWNLYDPKSEYIFKPSTGEVIFLAPIPAGTQNLKVIYKGGYDPDEIPTDLQMACTKLVAREFNRRKSQGILNESIGGGSISWSEDIPTDVKKTLDSYKRRSF